MTKDLIAVVDAFLSQHLQGKNPLLIGFSGGPDSLALLHVLLQIKSKYPVPLHLAHVDHGWREESRAEALYLQKRAQEWGLPFHLKRIDPQSCEGNLELACRIERLKFFAKLYREYECQALLLAHHADDQVETVLKRILEGVSLPFLSGIAEEKQMFGMTLWRPFLSVHKADIEDYLSNHALIPLQDRTNTDPRFLRGRMRTEILPALTQLFGKEITHSLLRISKEAQELRDELELKLQPYLDKWVVSHVGSFLDLSALYPASVVEFRYLLRKLAETQNTTLVHSVIDTLIPLIIQKKPNRRVLLKGITLEVDRGRLFLLTKSLSKCTTFQNLELGAQSYGAWNLYIEDARQHFACSSWKEAWQGMGSVILPQKKYTLGPARLNCRCWNGAMLGKWWTDHKVPAFLRNSIPVIYDGDTVAHEFLTGKQQETKGGSCFRITLEIGKTLPKPADKLVAD